MHENICPILFLCVGDIRLQELINGIIAVRAFDSFFERQRQNGWMLSQPPQVRFGTSETRTMYARLLPRADANSLPIDYITNRVGLSELKRDPCNEHVTDSRFRE